MQTRAPNAGSSGTINAAIMNQDKLQALASSLVYATYRATGLLRCSIDSPAKQ